MGTAGLILQAESREEILADKLVALAFRENRIKNRDLWDIGWLVQSGVGLPKELLPTKTDDHGRTWDDFSQSLKARIEALKQQPEMRHDFVKEMKRFLPTALIETVEKEMYWQYLTGVLDDLIHTALS